MYDLNRLKFECDFIMSIGFNCRPALYTRFWGLRVISSPLDWMTYYELDTVLELFQTSFKNFFIQIEESEEWEGIKSKRWITDTANHIVSIHHFTKQNSLEEEQKQFLTKMHKRYIQTNEYIKSSKKVILIANRNDSIDSLKSFLIKFGDLYKEQSFTLINIRDRGQRDSINEMYYVINERLAIAEFEFLDTGSFGDGINGNEMMWNSVMDKIHISESRLPFIEGLKHKMKNKKIMVYGAGIYGKRMVNFLIHNGIQVEVIAVTQLNTNPCKIQWIPVMAAENIKEMFKCSVVIIAVAGKTEGEMIKDHLMGLGANDIIEFSNTPLAYGI